MSLNVNITEQDKKTRIERFWVPYRSALSTLLKQYPNVELVLSMHSFTPCYEGNVREMHIGVLFMENETLATIVCRFYVDTLVTTYLTFYLYQLSLDEQSF